MLNGWSCEPRYGKNKVHFKDFFYGTPSIFNSEKNTVPINKVNFKEEHQI